MNSSMGKNPFTTFLSKLGYHAKNSTGFYFEYNPTNDNISFLIPFYFFPQLNFETKVFEQHRELWNKNMVSSFVVVSEYTTVLMNAKAKPDSQCPLNKTTVIKNFNYGINSANIDINDLQPICKTAVDSTAFFDFVIQRQRELKSNLEVDDDLLLNLTKLSDDLEEAGCKRHVAHMLILRCLFVKYLEDRGVFNPNYLLETLQKKSAEDLLTVFEEVEKINGDIFKYDELFKSNIRNKGFIVLLINFFSGDYRNKQATSSLFPYQFNLIPVQIVSNVYEAFLHKEKKKGKGIYYTPRHLVDFMLGKSFAKVLHQNPDAAILDIACGSGAYLVQAFKMIIQKKHAQKDFAMKKSILQNQIFGIDNDQYSLPIAAFSIYLTLLEDIDSDYIKKQIRIKNPILPSLIDVNLKKANTITDSISFGKKGNFECIIANPPWGSVTNKNQTEQDKHERLAIGKGDKPGFVPSLKNVADYQRSQAFILRANEWANANTVFCFIVNSSNFLNDQSFKFRKELLEKHRLQEFYDLSQLNPILFKKRSIKRTGEETIEIGATEPCCIVIFDNKIELIPKNQFDYFSPKLNKFSKALQLIQVTPFDTKKVRQTDLINEDMLWRIFVNGNWEDYSFIKRVILERDKTLEINCLNGNQITSIELSPPNPKNLVPAKAISPFKIAPNLIVSDFNWNRKLNKQTERTWLYQGKVILIKYTPVIGDNYRVTAALSNNGYVFINNVLGLKLSHVENYLPYLAILNSSFGGYYLSQISSNWGKGAGIFSLNSKHLKNFPFPKISPQNKLVKRLTQVITDISTGVLDYNKVVQKDIDKMVFDIYDFSDYEREIINEFFLVNVEKKNRIATPRDISTYIDAFRETFAFILDENLSLNAQYRISSNLGACVCFSIVKKQYYVNDAANTSIPYMDVLKNAEVKTYGFNSFIKEEKIKLYENDTFYIIKSNQFKDWTIRQAILDANEEIGIIMKQLPKG